MSGNDTHADTIRAALQRDPEHLTYSREAHMALDALVAERDRERARADRAEAALREIAEAKIEYRRDGHGFGHHLTNDRGEYLGDAAPALQKAARAVLSADSGRETAI